MPSDHDDELLIEVPPEYLRSLAEWLNREEPLRGRVSAVRPAPEAGKMGAAIELLSVALGSGGTGAVLVRSVSTWLGQRRSEVSVLLKDGKGNEFRFESKSVKQDPSQVFRAAAAMFAAVPEPAGEEGVDQETADRESVDQEQAGR